MLQERSLFGYEPKPLPYLLCQMNLLLHGLDAPQIDPGNALRYKLSEIGEKERVDVILTNPPFGGEEEKGIQGNFPEDRQAAETALLFLQLIMRKLRRRPTPAGRPARAAVVVPNGTLFGDGVCARIKEELLKELNLHTIVRLPNGVFAPYTSIPTNLLFFDRSGPTRDVWYYEHRLPEGRKNYTKTAPLQFEEFAACQAWWTQREENERAWTVPAAELLASNCNLDRKNPRAKEDIAHLPPEQIAPASSRRSSASRRSWATSRSSSPAAARDVSPPRLRPALSRADQGSQRPARISSPGVGARGQRAHDGHVPGGRASHRRVRAGWCQARSLREGAPPAFVERSHSEVRPWLRRG